MGFKRSRLKLQEFFPDEDINLGNIIATLGRRGSGKSVVTRALCQVLSRVIDFVVALTPTAEANDYPSFVPRTCIFEDFDADYVEDLITYQQTQWESGTGKEVLLILDDCAFDSKMFRSRAFRRLFFNGRHAHITVIITSQFALDMPPPIRAQIDLVFTACEYSDNTLVRLHENYFSIINSYRDFKRIMLEIAQKRHMLVMKNCYSESNDVSDRIFWYKAPWPVPPFRLGDPKLWEMDAECFIDRRREREEQRKKLKSIQKQILEDKAPIYDIEKSDTRKRNPEASLFSRAKRRRAPVFNADPNTIAPRAMDSWKTKYPLHSNPHKLRAHHQDQDVSYQRMKRKYGESY